MDDARRVAQKLDIPYYVMNFKKEFKENVIDYFIREYLEARTPNPCIACNRYVKWEALLKRSLEIGADYIATGHYARIKKLPNGRFTLQQSAALAKDQTYALYNLTQEQLSHTLMPAGEYTKEEIRKIAEEAGIPVANKPDSQEICFVQDNDYAKYMKIRLDRSCQKEILSIWKEMFWESIKGSFIIRSDRERDWGLPWADRYLLLISEKIRMKS